MGISCDEALLDRVCLLLERGFAAVYLGLGKCSVEVCLVCWPVSVSFHSVDLLVRFAESRGFCCFSGRWFVPYLFKRLLWWSGRM